VKLTFKFFRDDGGRLRATLEEFNITKPVERRDGKRYKILKVFSLPPGIRCAIKTSDVYRLQTAQAGDVVEVVLGV